MTASRPTGSSRTVALTLLSIAVAAPAIGIAASAWGPTADLEHAPTIECGAPLPEGSHDYYAPANRYIYPDGRTRYYRYRYQGNERTPTANGRSYQHAFTLSGGGSNAPKLGCGDTSGPIYVLPHRNLDRSPGPAFLGALVGFCCLVPGGVLSVTSRSAGRDGYPHSPVPRRPTP